MDNKTNASSEIERNLDIFVIRNEDDFEGKLTTWDEVVIHGDPEGLRSFANVLIDLANTHQDKIDGDQLPVGERQHIKWRPGFEISKSSDEVTIGRLDAKKTGEFYNRFIPR